MTRPKGLPVVLALLLLGALQAAAQETPEEPVFKVDVRLVNLLVTVKDSGGAPIGDLKREDFQIMDGGRVREVAVFERRTNRPLSVVLMLDASLSTAIELRFERESAKRFLENLLGAGSNAADRAAILKFSDYVDLLSGFTRSQKRLAQALERVRPESGTSMYDAILLCSDELARRRGRRVMIIITDGGDTTSRISFQRAQEAAHAVDAVIYGIIVMPIKSDAGRNTGGENALKTFAKNTGGTTFVEPGPEALNAAFDEILRNLRTQYLIGYYPPEDSTSTERFRPVKVTVDRPGAQVLARNGYYVPVARRSPPPSRITLQPKAGEGGEAAEEPLPATGKKRSP